MARLLGQVAAVTGGSQGIGRGIVLRFAREGAKIVFCSRDAAKGEACRREIEAIGAACLYVQADVSVRAEAQEAVHKAVQAFGRIDILINNAQVYSLRLPLDEKTDDLFQTSLRSGLFASLWTMQAAFPFMRDQGGGVILNFGSTAGTIGQRLQGDYASTKEAICGLTRNAAQEWGRYNIRVNVIRPAALSPAGANIAKALTPGIPMRRMGDPDSDVAVAVLGLVSERCRFITGQTIHVDGGVHLTRPRVDYDAYWRTTDGQTGLTS